MSGVPSSLRSPTAMARGRSDCGKLAVVKPCSADALIKESTPHDPLLRNSCTLGPSSL
jgi:hypothetical protein